MRHHLFDRVAGVRGFRQMLVVLPLLAMLAAPLEALAVPRASDGTYVVRRGDTLALIAAREGISESTLASANSIGSSGMLYVGQILVLPRSSEVSAGDSNPSLASSTDATGLSELASSSTVSVHVVRKGETLAEIAARYSTTVKALLAANGISNPNRIYVGEKLVIREGKTTTTTQKAAPASKAGRWIDINLKKQRLTAYQGKTAVFSTLVSTGVAGRRTPVGRFKVRVKVRAQTMSGPGYRLPNVPYVMYFAGANAIHGTYWHKNFGHPMSHGCVNLPTSAAKWLYNWAKVGTPVVTHY